ncbi:Low-affinity potassium transport protein [Purpureocillium lavendulum]|uniref:DNA-binding protein RAP1 n=1 Tax=Purpureocillium lavendulum TaxID=1247861 RepID=A0AB34FGI8_9HYPO|nr:Low-affinity potassium transport protein [Purpureocillium lavendulum]
MASGITYDGVASAEGGNIFKDVSFWVARRVPMRDSIVHKITASCPSHAAASAMRSNSRLQSNRGTVVALEKDADILIADHARKDAPPGSYSWKFVTESVDNGIIQIKDRYRIGPDPDLPRAVGSTSRPGKTTRTPFSHEDDVALVKWVLRSGQHLAGNKIYQEFEQTVSSVSEKSLPVILTSHQNPRHTWQSWRDRFTRMLQPKGQVYLENLAGEASPEPPSPIQERKEPRAQEAEETPATTRRKPPSRPPQRPQSEQKQGNGQKQQQVHRPSAASRVSNASRDPSASPVAALVRPPAAQTPRRSDHRQPPSPVAEATDEDEMDVMARIFIDDIITYAEEIGKDIDLETRIGGKDVGLWELSQAVEAQKVHRDEVDWLKVAEDLGFDFDPTGRVPDELCQCYRENLLEFLEQMSDYESDDEEGSGGSSVASGQPATRSPGLFVSSSSPSDPSPPQETAKKRPLDAQQPASSGHGVKRRRLDPNLEIPSTPEEQMRSTKQPRSMQTLSPSVRKSLASSRIQVANGSSHLSPLRQDEGMTQEGSLAFETQVRLPPRLQTHESSVEITPSQQLHSEAMDVTPIPLRLQKNPGSGERAASTGHARRRAGSTSSIQAKTQTKVTKRTLPPTFTGPSEAAHVSPTQGTERRQTARPAAQPQPQKATSKDAKLDIPYWVDHYQALGYPHKHVVEAMHRTTLTPGFCATMIMDCLRNGEGIPKDYQGVWTDKDDAALRSVDATRAMGSTADAKATRKAARDEQRLMRKHTPELVALRRRYLEDKDILESRA